MSISSKLRTLRQDGSRKGVHPSEVSGRYATIRKIVFAILLVVMVATPWILVGGQPLVLLDVAHRRFFLGGRAFGAGDGWLLFFLLSGLGFALVVVTAVWGRVFCGYICPQTVFIEGVYRRLERLAMGRAEARRRLEERPWTAEKLARTAAKHALYLVASLFFAHVVLGYFVPVRGLVATLREGPAAHPEAFAWTMGTAALLHFDFGWFREQFCVIMCPYGRLQGLMTDEHSVNVGYDVARGEPRGKVSLKLADQRAGDCVDCNRCVVVCPTGIDIRQGSQMECIGCSACVDACDEIMLKVGRPTGLIRYDSDAGFHGEPARWLRPRTVGYAVAGVLGLVVAGLALRTRTTFDAVTLRAQGLPYVLEAGEVRNPVRVRLTNKDAFARTFDVSISVPTGYTVVAPMAKPTVPPGQTLDVPVLLSVERAAYMAGTTITITIRSDDGGEKIMKLPVLGP